MAITTVSVHRADTFKAHAASSPEGATLVSYATLELNIEDANGQRMELKVFMDREKFDMAQRIAAAINAATETALPHAA